LSRTRLDDDQVTGTQLLDRAVSVLTYLGDVGDTGARVATIAEVLSLKSSTAHRIVNALERHGLIERDDVSKRYRLGLSIFKLASKAADGTSMWRICHPALLRIAAKTGDTVFLMGRSGPDAVTIDRQEGTYVIASLTGRIGGHIPLGVGPASQAILAMLPEEEAELILEINVSRYSAFNGLSADEIRSRLPEIRELGYALDHGRLVEGISAVAIPIMSPSRRVSTSISINMTSARLQPERLQELTGLIREEIGVIEKSINPLDIDIATRSGIQPKAVAAKRDALNAE
jgi:DNA-binding IclR family transcriptional regulator